MMHKGLVRRLDLITLQLFVAVFEEGTLTRAANREAIAVSAASKRWMELEQVLGVSLFVWRAKGMELTAAGETLLAPSRHRYLHKYWSIPKFGCAAALAFDLACDFDLRRPVNHAGRTQA